MIVLYFKCRACGKVFGIDPAGKQEIKFVENFEEQLFSGERYLPFSCLNILHPCDNHTFGPAEFIYGKKALNPEDI